MFKHMDYVYAVYEERSFTKAAEKLYISQPSLSATIGKLEKELGYPIFQRGGREILPTYIGKKYIKAAEEILKIQKNLEMEIDDLLKLRKGSIILGSTTFIVSYVLPGLLARFGEKYPDIEIKVLVEQSTTLYEKLENGLVDIAIDNALNKSPEYVYIPLFREQILLGVPEHFDRNLDCIDYQIPPMALKDENAKRESLPRIPISRFADLPFILLKNGNKMRQIAGNIFNEGNVNPKICYEFDQLMTSLSFAEHGFGLCFLTDTILKFVGPSKGITYYLPETSFSQRTLYIMYKKNRYLSHACSEWIHFLQSREK